MGYVMVPVPEEHVEEAMQLILRLSARARQLPWDAESVDRFFSAVDEPSRAVMSAVARGTKANGAVADSKVAELIEFPQREVLGITRELNERASADGRSLLVFVRQETTTLPNGRSREQRMMSMEPEVVEFVRSAERAEARSAPHPLMGDQA